ncbi:MAG: right-handed parallel beta-helix repeat-containing protein [Candidatus Thorarchaeota archaeon]
MSINRCRNSTIALNEFKNITFSGLEAWSNFDVHIVENSFRAATNEDAFSWAGIWVRGGELITIQRNVVSDFGFWGIDVSGRNHTVKENNITSCQTAGILVRTNNSTIMGNRINGSFNAIEMVQANNTMVHGNTIFGRRAYETGIAIYGGYDCDIYSNDISLVAQGIYLQGATRYNVSSNSVTDGRYGFVFGWYTNWGEPEGPFFDCDIVDNTFDGGGVFPRIQNYESWEFDTIRFTGNTVHGEPIGFWPVATCELYWGYDIGR